MPKKEEKKLRETLSLCPVCLEIIKADVISKKDKVYIKKRCEKHGMFEHLHVWDKKEIYNIMESLIPKKIIKSRGTVINITSNCNLDCNYCYARIHNIPYHDMPFSKIKKKIDDYVGDIIYLSGGEPTTRKDIFEIISYVKKKKKTVILFTNGLLLTNKEYVKKIKQCGTDLVIFSLNSFNEKKSKEYYKINVINKKKKALENLKQFQIPTYIFNMIKDSKKNEIFDFMEYARSNHDFIKIISFNPVWDIGKTNKYDKKITTGYILDQLISNSNLKKEDFFISTKFIHAFSQSISKLNNHAACELKCYVFFYNNNLIPMTQLLDLKKITNYLEKSNSTNFLFSKLYYGLCIFNSVLGSCIKNKITRKMLFEKLKEKISYFKKSKFSLSGITCIIVGSFPNAENIDLEFSKSCNLYSDIPDSDLFFSACIRQIFFNKSKKFKEFQKNAKEFDLEII